MKKLIRTSVLAILLVSVTLGLTGSASAAQATVDLKTATSFAILAGTPDITNVPTSVITGNVGLSPAAGSGIKLTQAQVTGTMYAVDGSGPAGTVFDKALVDQAKLDLTAAYLDAAGRTPFTVLDSPELGGRTLNAGVYTTGSTALNITGGVDGPGPLVLDAQNNASAVFIFEGSDEEAGALTVGPGGTVSLINGASACNVFWRVYGATIDTSAVFKGNILALTSITVAGGVGTESNIEGRLLARNGNVTLDHTTVAVPICTLATTTATSTSTRKKQSVTTPTPTPMASAIPTPAPLLPNTGNAPTKTNMAWYYAVIPAGILVVVLISVYVVRRKQRI